jgi:hydrogenase maturation protease
MIAVIGCGNSNRRDDGVGSEVVRLLGDRGIAGDPLVRLLDAGTDGMAVMFAARACRRVIIIDACRSGSDAGAVFEVPGAELEARHEPSLTLHDFRWDHALYAGRRLFGETFPSAVTVFLVETESVDLGIGLSPAVAASALQVADRIETMVRGRLSLEAES